jgi:multiple sugar transport system permease protein
MPTAAPGLEVVVPMYLIYAQIGLMDTYPGLVLAYLTFNLSFYVWVLHSFCRDLPVEVEEAAMVEGYTRLHIFRRFTLPLLRPGIVSTAVLRQCLSVGSRMDCGA